MDDVPSPEELQRRLAGNQPPVASLIADVLAGFTNDPIGAAASVIVALDRHYQLMPR